MYTQISLTSTVLSFKIHPDDGESLPNPTYFY